MQRSSTRRRITIAARVSLATGGGVNQRMVSDVCEQIGLHPHAFRSLFPTDDVLLDAVNELLVEECAERLQGGVSAFTPKGDGSEFTEAALALAKSWPLDRSAMIIRAERRFLALHKGEGDRTVTAAERRFVSVLTSVFNGLLPKLDRTFSWNPTLAVRVILDTWERSFEAWLLDGHSESSFFESPYIARTLPALLEQVSERRT
ncbi:hypothetical protein [Cryobacterium psychrophilum]|uniref:TetR/AcrR family transcriptional regulator n=1 Tax=Cryobacterium psychrophilum TaxID=41988 RepID=A0A4Y8KPD8_9MICO|nr:hypothetical protein [Cryobacterium psychrophilum]TDW29200.1 hypothetical protein EDD25_0887 [Cryobacterium psychrophilum]TFD74650.1 hypothetical protein E3T53_16920 [Cryobacterium psychrophilum]